MNRLPFAAIPLLIMLSLAAACAQPPDAAAAHGARGNVCPRCNACCRLKVERVDEEKTCWKVECEQICVPRVVFPWQKNDCQPCANNGAFIKTIKVLKAHTYTCPTCEYSWTPVQKGPAPCCVAGGIGGGGHCGRAGCGCCKDPVPTPAWQPHPVGPATTPAPLPAPPAASLQPAFNTSAVHNAGADRFVEPAVPSQVSELQPVDLTGQRSLIRKVTDLFANP